MATGDVLEDVSDINIYETMAEPLAAYGSRDLSGDWAGAVGSAVSG